MNHPACTCGHNRFRTAKGRASKSGNRLATGKYKVLACRFCASTRIVPR
jgi:hypothetical protein